ncbi:hypothetical protein WAE61_18190 [Comamonadaceae bacterium PP-2]
MPITITLSSLPDGRVFVHSSHQPQVGAKATPAQCLAMDMLNAAPREYPVYAGAPEAMRPALAEIYQSREI